MTIGNKQHNEMNYTCTNVISVFFMFIIFYLGGNILPPPFHPAPNFPAYAPVPLAAATIDPRPFLAPQIFYWPYPSPPVSPTSYYPTIPPPGALQPQQPQQPMVSKEL